MARLYPSEVSLKSMAMLRNRVAELGAVNETINGPYSAPKMEDIIVTCEDIAKLAHTIIECADEVLHSIESSQESSYLPKR